MKSGKNKNNLTDEYDYIIVGAGSAGSALAYRMAHDDNKKILLLEFGGKNNSLLIKMPAALSYPMNMKKYNWGYTASAEEALNGRSLNCPRGKGLGGSSSINGMIFVRGHPLDFDNWEKKGAQGWSYSDVLPYFKKMENSDQLKSKWRGKNGPMHVQKAKQKNILHKAFTDSAVEAGFELTEDYNGYKQQGVGAADMTIYRGQRWSAARAYLDRIDRRKNIKILTKCLVDKLLFANNKCIGLTFINDGKKYQVRCIKGVVLAAGAIGSPSILQRSGIGPLNLLKKLGIKPIVGLDGVGKNLQDHLELYFQVKCKLPVTLYKDTNIFSKSSIFLKWLFFKTGIGASNQFETLGFLKTDSKQAYPNLQYHFLPLAVKYDGSAPFSGHGFQFHIGTMRSKSRGFIEIIDTNPFSHPNIQFNYLSDPDDLQDFRNAIKISRKILEQPPFRKFLDKEINPGSELKTDTQLDDYIRSNVESAYHPCGSCKMGSEYDLETVVTPDCKVKGTQNLYCADSSIFPAITNGNLNAPSIMVGEKAADHILNNSLLPKDNSIPFI